MRRSTFAELLRPLEYAVQVGEKGGGGGEWWETIAAFNVKGVAQRYMNDCAHAHTARSYRLVCLDDNLAPKFGWVISTAGGRCLFLAGRRDFSEFVKNVPCNVSWWRIPHLDWDADY